MDKYILRQYRHLLAEIDDLEKEKKHVLDRYLAPPQPTGMPTAHNAVDRIGNVVAMRDKYQQLIDAKLDELVNLRHEIEEAISTLPAEDRRLMRLRYIQGKSWRCIAYKMHYSVDWVWHRHGEILRQIK